MKKIISVFLILVSVFCIPCFTASAADDKLTVYNWADYIYDTQLTEFKEYYKQTTGRTIDITYVTFDTNETMLTKIMKGSANVDVICPSEYAIQRLLDNDCLIKIDYFTDSSFINSKYVNPIIVSKIRESFSDIGKDMTEYMVPYMWGTLGVLYNTDEISSEKAEASGWGLLWNLDIGGSEFDVKLNKKIYMKDSIRDSYCAVLMYMKERGTLPEAYASLSVQELINRVDDDLLAKAQEVLTAQKPILYGYEVDFGKNELISGVALADLAWSGDALYAIEEAEAEGVNLDYYAPESGTNVWFDGWVIPKGCEHVEAAKLFIDFMNRPDIAMKNMMEIGYVSAVDASVLSENEDAVAVLAESYADDPEDEAEVAEVCESFFGDKVRYPDINSASFGVMRDFGNSNEKVVTMWEHVRGSNVSVKGIIIALAVVLVVAIAVFAVIQLGKGKKRSRVKAK